MGTAVMRVKNRTNKLHEFVFDGQVYQIPANDTVMMLADAAKHGIKKSIISFNPITNLAVRALCEASADEADEEVEARDPEKEVIDREGQEGETKTIKFSNPDLRRSRVTSALED